MFAGGTPLYEQGGPRPVRLGEEAEVAVDEDYRTRARARGRGWKWH